MAVFASLVDGFDTAIDPAVWTAPTVTVASDALVVSTGARVDSIAAADLTAGPVVVRVNQTDGVNIHGFSVTVASAVPGVLTGFSVTVFEGETPRLTYLYPIDGGTAAPSVVYDPVAHAHLRVSLSGSLLFETSPDGATWATLDTSPVIPDDFSASTVTLEGEIGVSFDEMSIVGVAYPFTGTDIDPAQWTAWRVHVIDGKVVLSSDEIYTVDTYDLTGSQVMLRVSGVDLDAGNELYISNVDTGAIVSVYLSTGTDSYALWRDLFTGGTSDYVYFTYNPVDHAYLRFSEDPTGIASIQSSPDGVTWTTLITSTVPVGLSAGRLVIDGTLNVDSVNVASGLTACGPIVKAAQVQENFATGLSNPRWIVDSGVVEAGSGTVATASDPATPVRFHWQCPVDLTESTIMTSVRPDVYLNTYYHFAMVIDSDNYVSFVVVGPNPDALRFRMCKAGVVTDTFLDYDATRHAWWRFAEAGGVLRWDVGSNGQAWSNGRVATHGMNLAAVTIVFENGAHELGVGFGGSLFGIGNPGFGD